MKGSRIETVPMSLRTPGSIRRTALRVATAAFIPLLILLSSLSIVLRDEAFADGVDALLLLLNILPFLFFGMMLWSISGRPLFALACSLLLLNGVYSIHSLKLAQIAEPLLPGDLLMVPQVLGNLGFFLRYTQQSAWLILVAILLAGLWWLESPGWPRRLLARLPLAVVSFMLLWSLAHGLWPWQTLYREPPVVFQPWDPRGSAAQSGMPAYFISLSWSSQLRIDAPDATRLAAVNARLANLESEPVADEKPDIVVLQSESFFDPGLLRGVDSETYIPALLALSKDHLSGNLAVPAYGGQTTRTEFEMLTGITLKATPTIQYPYQGLMHRSLQSLPLQLRDQGYQTLGIHPYPASFYRRDTIFPRLGFDRLIDIADFGNVPRHGYYVSDATLVDRVLKELDAPGDAPRFIYAISMENHGPWNEGRLALLGSEVEAGAPSGLDRSAALPLDLFLHHLKRGDAALARLAEAVSKRPRPTVMLFFGDHLPGLHESFKALGFRNDRHAWQQTVPYVLLHNRKSLSGRIDLQSSELPALLLEAAELPLRHHFRQLAQLRRTRSLAPLETDHLRQEIALHALSLSDSGVATGAVRIFGISPQPATLKADDDAPIMLRLHATGLPDGASLSLGGEKLESRPFGDGLMATAPHELLTRVHEGELGAQLKLILPDADPILIEDLDVRAAEPLVKPRGFCAVEGWGPQITKAGKPVNAQPDGTEGLWIKLGCFPSSARVLVDGKAVETFHDGNLITAKIPLALIGEPRDLAVEVDDRKSDERLLIGNLQVREN